MKFLYRHLGFVRGASETISLGCGKGITRAKTKKRPDPAKGPALEIFKYVLSLLYTAAAILAAITSALATGATIRRTVASLGAMGSFFVRIHNRDNLKVNLQSCDNQVSYANIEHAKSTFITQCFV